MRTDPQTRPSPWQVFRNCAGNSPATENIWNRPPFSDLSPALAGAGLPAEAIARALRAERDPEILYASLYRLASDLEDRMAVAASAQIFSFLSGSDAAELGVPERVRAAARGRVQAQSGSGGAGGRIEFFGKRFAAEAVTPAGLISFAGTAFAGRALQGYLLRRLGGSVASWWTRGWAAHGLAAGSALAFEIPTYALAARGLDSLAGKPHGQDIWAEMAVAALFLGAIKLSRLATREPWRELAPPQKFPRIGEAIPAPSVKKLTVNATPLGSDAAVPLKTKTLWEPPRDLVASVPTYLLSAPPRTGFSPVLLELQLAAAAGRLPVRPPAVLAAPREAGGAQPPPHPGFRQEAADWARQHQFGETEAALVEALLEKIRRQMWGVLNFHSGSRLAHRLVAGKPIALRLTPEGEGLSDYSLELLDSRHSQQNLTDSVQLAFDPVLGSLAPMEFLGQVSFEIQAKEGGIDVTHGFIPFYRKLQLSSPALSVKHLLPHVPPALRNMASADPTIFGPGPAFTAPQPAAPAAEVRIQEKEATVQPTLLVKYRPLVFEGTRVEVDRYADYQIANDEGRQRLHRLTQHILAELHEREARIELPENRSLRKSPAIHVIVGLNKAEPEKTKIEVLTMEEAFDRQVNQEIGENEVILFLLRNPNWGGAFHYSHLELHRVRPVEMGNSSTGAELDFENYLGLKNTFHMRWDIMNLHPKDLAEWDEWMIEKGYFPKK